MLQTFTHNEKLKSKKLTEALFAKGTTFFVYPYKVVHWVVPITFKMPASKAYIAGKPTKFGVSVSKRYFKKAVDRNRIKRQIRNTWRLQKHALITTQNVAVFIIYTPKQPCTYAQLSTATAKVIQQLSATVCTAANAI